MMNDMLFYHRVSLRPPTPNAHLCAPEARWKRKALYLPGRKVRCTSLPVYRPLQSSDRARRSINHDVSAFHGTTMMYIGISYMGKGNTEFPLKPKLVFDAVLARCQQTTLSAQQHGDYGYSR